MKKNILFFIFFTLTSLFNVAFSGTPKYSNEFLALGIGANSYALSGAVTGTVNDITAGYWNPAGLIGIDKKYDLALMHSEIFAGIIKYDYGALAYKLDKKSVIAASYIRLGVDDIPNTTQLIVDGGIDYNRISSFSVSDNALIISYAREAKVERFSRKVNRKLYNTEKRLSYGGNVKIIYRNIGEFAHAWGFGFDLGIQYRNQGWYLGAAAKDVTSTFNAWTVTLSDNVKNTFINTNNEIPKNGIETTLPSLNLGIGKKINFSSSIYALPAIELVNTFDGLRNTLIKSKNISISPKIGLTGAYKDLFFLRAGIGNFQTKTTILKTTETAYSLTFGLAIKFKHFELCYALTNNAVGLYSNIFSLRIMFDTL